jgi:hypothetical protein
MGPPYVAAIPKNIIRMKIGKGQHSNVSDAKFVVCMGLKIQVVVS